VTIMTVDVDAATAQWRQHLDRVGVPVLLAKNVNVLYDQPTIHILALQDLVLRSAKQTSRRNHRVLTGLDAGGPLPYFAEACFCVTESNLLVLTFSPWLERRRQHLYSVPTCLRCLRTLEVVTGIPTDAIRGKPAAGARS
jgi:hypothetical protein